MDEPNMEKKPFEPYKLEEERKKDKRDIFSVSLNPKQRAWLEESKKNLHISQDSTALKVLAEAGHNVLHGTFGAGTLKQITSQRRIREVQE